MCSNVIEIITGGFQMFDFELFKKSWPAPVVARSQVDVFSGGLLHPRTLRNLDSLGQGPPRIKLGRLVAYPVDGLVQWMQERAEGK